MTGVSRIQFSAVGHITVPKNHSTGPVSFIFIAISIGCQFGMPVA